MTIKKTVTLVLKVDFDPAVADEVAVRDAMDTLVQTALRTPGVLATCGSPDVGLFRLEED